MSPDRRLCLALDVDDAASARAWVRRTREIFGVYKIGLQLFCAEGPSVVAAVRDAGAEQIFLDLKLHDIPNTVAGAVRAAAEHGVDWLTVHAGGGGPMLRAAREAAADRLQLLAVTLLTSLGDAELRALGVTDSPGDLVTRRADLARAAGIHGLVCAVPEVEALRTRFGDAFTLVTPGLRLDHGADDQRRVATPARAVRAGADLLVVGRAVTAAVDVDAALAGLVSSLP